MSLGSLTISEFLDKLGSKDPTPGGGALAALAGAQAAAMLTMVCNLTLGRPRFAAVEGQVTEVLGEATQLRDSLLRLADADADAYGAVRDAYRLPHTTEGEETTRKTAIEAALHGATDVPVRSAEAARAVLELALATARIGNPSVLPDVSVAAFVAVAAVRGALTQAQFNLDTLADRAFALTVGERLAHAGAGLDGLTSDILEAVKSRAAS